MNKVLLTYMFADPTFTGESMNHMQLDTVYKLLVENNYEPWILSAKEITDERYNIVSLANLNVNDYYSLVIISDVFNYYGGKYKGCAVELISIMDKMERIYLLVLDGRIKFNYIETSVRRFKHDMKLIGVYREAEKRMKFLFDGKDLDRFYNYKYTIDPARVIQLDYMKYIAKVWFKKSAFVPNENKLYNVIYYGYNRDMHRKQRVMNFIDNVEGNCLVQFDPEFYPENVTYFKRLNWPMLRYIQNVSYSSLVVTDRGYYDNISPYRLHESLSSSAIAAIDLEFDPERQIIKNPELKKILYVETSNDINNLKYLYSEDIIKMQHDEFDQSINEANFKLNL